VRRNGHPKAAGPSKAATRAEVGVRAPRESHVMNTLTEAQRERVLALLREGKTLRRIEHETGHRRETIALYGRRARILDGEVADLDALRERATLCEPHREAIAAALEEGRSLRGVYAELRERRGFPGSYSTLKRYVKTHLCGPGTVTALLAA
jgi:hypothetical protein